uniref:Uncharacterized protein n=1 Tax=Cannabis sativa TaxID=3483 RepID=A0A803QJT6_CANSA
MEYSEETLQIASRFLPVDLMDLVFSMTRMAEKASRSWTVALSCGEVLTQLLLLRVSLQGGTGLHLECDWEDDGAHVAGSQ